MKNVIAGTAGHIDHGKTALVRALTGIDTDRLEEERRRGISIDLGFAHFTAGNGLRIALIDVPGHERFIKNMLAGVGGIDLVLFAVACDESIKPQTREHLDICHLLQVDRGVVALTKSDLVEVEIQELVALEVEELVRGTFLQGAPMVAVSSVTGDGIEALRTAIIEVAQAIPARESEGYVRIPIDRSFLVPGFGPVATGTLVAGAVALEDTLQLYPSNRIVRVRGIQVHGEAAPIARAGQRVALNLSGADVAQLPRGTVLGPPKIFDATRVIDAMLEVLPSAKVLKSRAPIRIHSGTAETIGEIRNAGEIRPGSLQPVRIALREPLLLLPQDRFVARMFSPVVTIGGGTVVEANPQRRFSVSRVRELASSGLENSLRRFTEDREHGIYLTELIRRTGIRAERLLLARGSLLAIGSSEIWVLSPAQAAGVIKLIREGLAAYHEREPLSPGQNREVLRSEYCRNVPAFVFDLLLNQQQSVVSEGERLRLTSHRVILQEEENEALTRIEQSFASAGLAVPSLSEVLEASGVETRRALSLVQILLSERKLLRISQELIFHASAVLNLRRRLKDWDRTAFSVSDFKELTGISRKYAIPLLEFLDRERVTRRVGDTRFVL